MFGYIRPRKPDLLIREYEVYKAVYCGLCRQLGREYGWISRFILSYDCTFLALFSLSLEQCSAVFSKGRCTVNPLKKCNFCSSEGGSFKLAAAFSVLSVYYKLKDDINDERIFKKLASYIMLPFASGWRKRALKKMPELDVLLADMVEDQLKSESSPDACVDSVCEPSANMLAGTFALLAGDDREKRLFSEFGYFLGKWIYLTDAADDIEKDKKKNRFNIFLTGQNQKEQVQQVLNGTLARLIAVYSLIDLRFYKGITDNIVYKGLSDTQSAVLINKNKPGKEKE